MNRKKSRPIKIGGPGVEKDEEQYKLLNLTDDSADDLDLVIQGQGGGGHPWKPNPPSSSRKATANQVKDDLFARRVETQSLFRAADNGIAAVTEKSRRKVRLKRRQRNCLVKNGVTGGGGGGGTGGGNGGINSSTTTDQLVSNSESCSDPEAPGGMVRRFVEVASCGCCGIPSESTAWNRDCQDGYRSNRGRLKNNRRHHPGHRIGGTAKCLGNGSMVISLLFFALTLGVISLTYFTVSLQARIADISMALEPVVAERKQLSDSNHDFNSRLVSLSANQSHLAANLTSLSTKVDQFSIQLYKLNTSVEALFKSLADAPYLKSIPGDVKEVKENVAKFGSKMTELESQLTSLQANVGQIKTEVQKNSKDNQIVEQQVMAARSVKQSSESSSSYSDDKLKIEKIQSVLKAQNNTLQSTKSDFIHFGTEATQKIQHLEQWYTKSGKLLGQMQDDIKNVTFRSLSNQENISNMRSKIDELTKTQESKKNISSKTKRETINRQEG